MKWQRGAMVAVILAALLVSLARAQTIPLAVGGGSTGGGAPTTATYITQTADAGLSAEQALASLSTGLLLNTTGTGVLSAYGGSSCTNQFVRSLNASGAATCASVATTDMVNSSITINGTAVSLGGTRTLAPLDLTGWPADASGCLSNNGSGTYSYTACAGASSNVTRLSVTGSDFTTSSVSLADVTGLTMTFAANTEYSFDCTLFWNTNATSVGATVAVNGPTTPTLFRAAFGINATNGTWPGYTVSTTYDSGVALTTGPGSAVTNVGYIRGSIHNAGNSGTFAVRWASETATITTVLQGSYCVVVKT